MPFMKCIEITVFNSYDLFYKHQITFWRTVRLLWLIQYISKKILSLTESPHRFFGSMFRFLFSFPCDHLIISQQTDHIGG